MAHQRGGDFANMRIRQYLEDEYWPARDFRTFLYMSHVLQGDAIKTAIEAHRRDKPYCWGSLFWQHNDCGPAATGTAAGRRNIISPARPSTTSSYRPLPRETR